MALEPAGCLAVECDGILVATATLVCYGSRLAWLGMVLTHPNYRRRGFARQLVTRALELADARGLETVKLDATEQGMGLYKDAGFREEHPIERWMGTAAGRAQASLKFDGLEKGVLELDPEAFPVDRSRLLQQLMTREPAFVCADGYLLRREGARAGYLGPCVARTAAAAERLLRECLAQTNGPLFWDLLPGNAEAVRLATIFGFQPDRRLVRMDRGRKLEEAHDRIYAIAGFELG